MALRIWQECQHCHRTFWRAMEAANVCPSCEAKGHEPSAESVARMERMQYPLCWPIRRQCDEILGEAYRDADVDPSPLSTLPGRPRFPALFDRAKFIRRCGAFLVVLGWCGAAAYVFETDLLLIPALAFLVALLLID